MRRWWCAVLLLVAFVAGCARPDAQSPQLSPAVRTSVPTVAPMASTAPSRPPAPDPCATPVIACVQLASAQAWLRPAGQAVIGPVPIGFGVAADATPTGTFHVVWKANANYVSREYGEPMPYAVFFAAGGVAFHGGPLNTSSHGCVHLSLADARLFFDTLAVGAQVQVLP